MSEMTFKRLDTSDLAAWLARTRVGYIESRTAAGETMAEATENADATLERTFPGGCPAPGQLVGRVMCDGKPVGELWLGSIGSDPARWWVWNVVVDEELRGRGYGRKTMLLAEHLARSEGAESIGLNVFAQNGVARSLYTSLGYEEASVQMRKDLSPSSSESAG